jgi:hypothetical protein
VQPLLVVFEDLHWIDSETQALLDGLVESLPAARLLLLVNYRPEYQHQWGSRTSYTQLRLDALPPESAEQLLGALLGPDAGLEPLTRVLIARTEGNPFYLEESVRALVETGSLSGEPGPRPSRGRPSERRSRPSSRRWRRLPIAPRPATRKRRPSMSASSFATRSSRWRNSGGSRGISGKPNAWPGRSTISGDSDGCRPI